MKNIQMIEWRLRLSQVPQIWQQLLPLPNGHEKKIFIYFFKTGRVEKPPKSNIAVNLEEPIYLIEDEGPFDVLKWWNQNSSKYFILNKLARDVLCIPITIVTSESAFSVGDRILDDYRSSLTKDMVEIIVCGGDWIKATSKTSIQTLRQYTKEEENLEIQIPMSNE